MAVHIDHIGPGVHPLERQGADAHRQQSHIQQGGHGVTGHSPADLAKSGKDLAAGSVRFILAVVMILAHGCPS